MNYKIYTLLNELDLYDHLKIFKDRFFKNELEKITEQKRFNFYSKIVKKNELCFDVGANYGNRSEVFLKLGAKVIAFEPQPKPLRFLKRKFKNNITILDKALGSHPGKSDLYISSASTLTSMSKEWIEKVKTNRFKQADWNNKIEVEMTTLDEMIIKYGKPDFCKIDVEGFEFEVLKGLTQPIGIISFEFTIPEFVDKAIECLNYLNNLGKIICNFSPGETLTFALEEWLNATDFMEMFKTLPAKGIVDGDIYIKFLNN
jgi:FkbM family methyltransferase